MTAEPPPTARAHLATRLRQIRYGAGLTSPQLAAIIGVAQSKISKVETGSQSIRPDHVDAWARACATDDQTRAWLLDLAEAAATEASSWHREHRAGVGAKQRRIAGLEQRATRLRNFEAGVVPGLLQTREYAAGILTRVNVSGQRDVSTAVNARMDRQQILDTEALQIELLISENALHWQPVQGVEADQRTKIARLARSQPGRIGIVPAKTIGVPPPLSGFAIYDIGDTDQRIVTVEVMAVELYHDDPREVASYVETFDELAAAAVYGDQAADLITGP